MRELALLNDLAVSVAIEEDLDEALDAVVRGATRAVKAEQGTVSLITDDPSLPLKTLVRQDENSKLRRRCRIGDYVTGWVLLNRESVRIEDLSRDKRFHASKEEEELIRSLLCIPVVIKGELIGVLQVINKAGGGIFTDEDFGFLNIVASQSGQLIRIKQLQQESSAKRLEAERARVESEKLHELNEQKSRFIANISHDLRTPLTLMIGPLREMLARSSGEGREELGLICRNAERLMRLIDELLDLSRLDEGKMNLSVTRGDITKFVSNIMDSFRPMAEQMSLSLHLIESLTEPNVYFDPEKVEKVLNNLLSNAFKFTPSGGEVSVSLSSVADSRKRPALDGTSPPAPFNFIEIVVSDNGIGIPQNQIDKIFDRFYRADNVLRSSDGCGIGLSLVKELVELHHGEVQVTSMPGNRTSFKVRFPAEQEAYEKDELAEWVFAHWHQRSIAVESIFQESGQNYSSVFSDDGERKDKPSVLIIEDNKDMMRYIRKCISQHYRTLSAYSGEDGLQDALENVPDLVLSDVMMPGMDGFELCRTLKSDERTSHIPVVLLTAWASVGDKIAGLETGADDYLAKPFDPRELVARIGNLIEQRKKLRERFSRQEVLEPRDLAVTPVDAKFLDRLASLVDENIADINFGVEILSSEMGMSRIQMYRKTRALTDQTVNEFIQTMRLKRAANLLKMRGGNVAEIAYSVGFDNPSYFAKCFRVLYGKSPSEYRKG